MNPTESYFISVPNEIDTTILKNKFKNINDIPVLFQLWAWDGVTACSAVIPKEFTRNFKESELISILRQEVKIDDSYTLKNSGNYTFVNYGFCH